MRAQGPYSAYFSRPIPDQDSPLGKVGPGTAGGEYLRRFWHPICLSSEIKDLPFPLRILGEDLVAFRDKAGRLGLLHRTCIHRGVSLEFGIIEERGIRCCYHGWLFAVDGTVVETPAEPPTSRIKENFCQGAYPVRELHGLVFAYMGPPDLQPELPIYDTFGHPAGTSLHPYKLFHPCNWLQVVENACDPIHNAYLHAIVSGVQFSPAFKILPALDFIETPLGFLSMATRRVKDFVFIRAGEIIMPNVAQFTGASRVDRENFGISSLLTRWVVPIDDENCFYTGLMHLNDFTNSDGQLTPDLFGVGKTNLIGQTPDRPYRERQLEPGDYDALISQGTLANRRNEHLGTTDRGVVMFRRKLARDQKAVENGEAPSLPRLYADRNVPTYCYELVFELPSQSQIGDLSSLQNFGQCASAVIIDSGELDPTSRETEAKKRIHALMSNELVS